MALSAAGGPGGVEWSAAMPQMLLDIDETRQDGGPPRAVTGGAMATVAGDPA